MMKRYAVKAKRPRAYWDEEDFEVANRPSLTVHEPKDEQIETGLYDHLGNELMRLPEKRRPIGFCHVYEMDD